VGHYIFKSLDIIVCEAVNASILCRNEVMQVKTKYSSMTYHQKKKMLYSFNGWC